jgi:eukaryotic-like serine/threonine-protein kinase
MRSHPLLAGRYRLESQIATGGVGEVWRAEDTVLTRPVAVKLLRAEFAGHAEMQERFRAEARHAGALSHPAIARVYDYCEPAPEHPAFLVMELVDGPSLAAVLAAGALGAAQTMDVVPRSRRACRPRTRPRWCTATSSRPTCCWPRTAR